MSLCRVLHFLIDMLNVITVSVAFPYCYTECHNAGWQYAECHYAECQYAECHYAEYRYAECRDAKHTSLQQ